MRTWRLLDSGPLPAKLNMGVDLALLELHARGVSPPTLRFYQWAPAAISLGYFQRHHAIDLATCQQLGLDVVTRATGGHAVLHQNDLTYSVIAGVADGIPRTLATAYALINGGLQAGFRLLGVDTQRWQESATSTNTDVCFLRFAPGDLLHTGRKFVGSAQTWKNASILQHGSIILEPQMDSWVALLGHKLSNTTELRNQLTSRTTSLSEILGRKVATQELKTALVAGIAAALNVELQPGELTADEQVLASKIAGLPNRHDSDATSNAANLTKE